MAVPELTVEEPHAGVVVNVPLAIDIQTSGLPIDVLVFYGSLKQLAVQGVDYTIDWAGNNPAAPGADLSTFNITPLAALMTKITADGTNIIYVQRRLTFTSDFDLENAFVRQKLVDEFNRIWFSVQQLDFLQGDTANAADSALAAAVSASQALASQLAAAASAVTATTQAGIAGVQAGNAATSATAAAGSATAANTSKVNAATSETNAAASAAAALTSKNNAATSETNAANSATAANTSKVNAATSETNAAASAAAALISKNNAATSETNAATSATNASNSAAAAAASAASINVDALMPVGAEIDFDGHTAPVKWLFCAGQNVSRATYASLFAALIKSLAGVTVTIATPAVVSWANHGRLAGDKIRFTTTGALPTGLVANTDYYIITAGLVAGSFQLSATPGGAAINTSGTQSGVHTGIHAPHGVGDGSTTFGIPDRRGVVTVGVDNMLNSAAGRNVANASTGSMDGTVMGAIGGDDTHLMTSGELIAHTHPVTAPTSAHSVDAATTTYTNSGPISSGNVSIVIGNSATGGTAFSVMQPSAITKKIIFANA